MLVSAKIKELKIDISRIQREISYKEIELQAWEEDPEGEYVHFSDENEILSRIDFLKYCIRECQEEIDSLKKGVIYNEH